MELLSGLGYIGLFIGCFLAATVVPFSSDFLMVGILMTGANPIVSLIVATIGNWLGGLTSYYIGYIGKWNWIEKWFRVKEETLLKQKGKVDKFGSGLAFFTWLPIVGDIFAVCLGFYRVNFTKSAIFMLLGKGARFAFWALLYHYLGNHVLDLNFL
jgi:membrane protein YqaA with SNARE-associated domain